MHPEPYVNEAAQSTMMDRIFNRGTAVRSKQAYPLATQLGKPPSMFMTVARGHRASGIGGLLRVENPSESVGLLNKRSTREPRYVSLAQVLAE